MPRIFISYRRTESESEVGRLFDYLERELGTRNVFKDVNSIAAGEDFRQAITTNVKNADIFLLIIGENWSDVRDDAGRRRIEQPDDFVHIELLTALSNGLRVIPVLVRAARMPSSADLPDDIAQVAYRNALRLRPDPDFRGDCSRLLAEITGAKTRRILLKVATAAVVTLVALASIYALPQFLSREAPAPPDRPAVTAAVSPDVVATGKKILSNLDQTRNTGTGYDYWPDGGIRIAYDHLATFAGYETLAKLSPHPIFVSGPHGTRNLNLNDRFAFGHYNPEFLRWFYDQLLQILQDRDFIESTTSLFKDYLGSTALTYWSTYITLYENPDELAALLQDYKKRIDDRTLPRGYYYNTAWQEAEQQFDSLKSLSASYDSNVIAPAIYFWLRRHIDGTHQQIFSMLDTLLGAYEMVEPQELYFKPEELPRVR